MSGSFEGLEDAKVWLFPGQIIVSKHLDISEFVEIIIFENIVLRHKLG